MINYSIGSKPVPFFPSCSFYWYSLFSVIFAWLHSKEQDEKGAKDREEEVKGEKKISNEEKMEVFKYLITFPLFRIEHFSQCSFCSYSHIHTHCLSLFEHNYISFSDWKKKDGFPFIFQYFNCVYVAFIRISYYYFFSS